MELIHSLKEEQKRLQDELVSVNIKLKDALDKISIDKYGIRIGSIINSSGNIYIIRSVYMNWEREQPWLKCSKKKKNGDFSNAEHIITTWTLEDY